MLGRRLWGLFLFLLAAASLGASAYLYDQLQQERAALAAQQKELAAFSPRFDQFKDAVRDVDRRLSSTVFQEVDLGATGWQPIAGGLYVIDLGASPVGQGGKGTRITGKIINPTSVTHDSAQLSVRSGEKKATFTLAHLPPTVAEPFEVTLPDVPAGSIHKIFFALDGSTISFASSSTRKRGADPVDTDKMLR